MGDPNELNRYPLQYGVLGLGVEIANEYAARLVATPPGGYADAECQVAGEGCPLG